MTDHFLLRATASREVLYCHDPVLHEVALERPFAVREYFATRRIEALGLTDEQLGRAAIFVCEPLRAKYRGLALEGNPVQLRAIFAAHVSAIKTCRSSPSSTRTPRASGSWPTSGSTSSATR